MIPRKDDSDFTILKFLLKGCCMNIFIFEKFDELIYFGFPFENSLKKKIDKYLTSELQNKTKTLE